MYTTQTQLLRLSQGHLNLLETCPRKFQHLYLDKLSSPTSLEQQEKQDWGSRFHLLMQQRELGLPIDFLIQEDTQLQECITALVNAAPEILNPDAQTFRQSEHCQTLTVQGYLLTVIYDLLIVDSQQAQIIDWKTYPKPKNQHWLEKDWQTRLYLYVLVETSEQLQGTRLQPEQISMTYWFVKSQPKPQCLKFTYNAALHEQTRQDLTYWLTQLSSWLQEYREGKDFPQVPDSAVQCPKCNFTVRCQRTPESLGNTDEGWLSNLADIQEVVL